MKKYLLILLALLPMMLFTACSSDKEEETPNNLVGTTWQYLEKEGNKITSMTVLEFKSNTVVKIITDEDLDKNPTERDHDEGDATYVLMVIKYLLNEIFIVLGVKLMVIR